ncbi:MAG: hypothetical protein E6Q24_17955 [Chitinophagaceae bacterium]|jgi:hypothetical protein|nr:MAG: hypothetical protein E6Q24_17955 [Chitinophagaceae bacterium]
MERIATKDKGNFFFGFHDLVAWNASGNRLAALRIDDMSTPPVPGMQCDVGFISQGSFVKLGQTSAYNYPQGARQQWIGKTDLLIVNDKVGDDWGCRIFDTNTLQQTATIGHPTHVITDEGWAFGIDYARLHRLGGYGYTGIKDKTAGEDTPAGSGILKHNVFTGESHLLVSIKEVAEIQAGTYYGHHHYITHLLLNPSQTRIAFLHRSKLKDGGETTRLMTIGIDGKDLRCLATGFLSHFDWKDDHAIAIWARIGSGVEKLRNSFLYKLMPSGFIAAGKKLVKKIIGAKANPANRNSPFQWMVFTDEPQASYTYLAKDVINEDGHPMFCPANRDWLVCDNYPDKDGVRTLFLFQVSTQKKIELGKYKMIDDKPDLAKIDDALVDVEPFVLKAFDIKKMAFYRSGLHCDLHPRWKADGTEVAFDSIHEGRRAIYTYDVSSFIQ